MHQLTRLTEIRNRIRVIYPQYWLNKLINEIQTANKDIKGSLLFGQVLAQLTHPESGERVIIPGLNIVTTAGDVYYAQLAMSDSLTKDFQGAGAGIRLGSDATAPDKADTDVTTFLSGTDHAIAATYPTSADADADNTGSGASVMTWTYSYLTSEGNAVGIAEGAISDVRAGPSTAVLTHFLFAAVFTKTSSDTLKTIINHTILGV